MSYTEELNHRLDVILVAAIREVVRESGIHPLEPDFLRMLETKITACAVEVYVKLGSPSKETWKKEHNALQN